MKEMANPPESVLQHYQALQEKLEAQREAERQDRHRLEDEKLQRIEADQAAASQRAEQMEAERENLKDELNKERLESMRRDFAQKMEDLQKTIQTGASQKSFTEQFSEAQAIAAQLGFEKTTGGKDPTVELELKKMEWQMKKEDREFQRQMKKDERDWQLRIEEIKDQREFRRAELDQQAKKDEMFASFPQRIGAAFAKGVIDSETEEGAAPHISRAAGKQTYHVEIGEGEAGEVSCPKCGTAVGVGPSSKAAICVGCNSKFDVTRKTTRSPEPDLEPVTADEEEE